MSNQNLNQLIDKALENITADREETKELLEEGIEVSSIPWVEKEN